VNALVQQRTDVPTSVPEMMQVAKYMAASKMLPPHLSGDEASVFSVMLAARSLDIPMWAAFQQVIVQKGKVAMTSTLMQALVLRAGYDLFVREDVSGPQGATVRAVRPGIGHDGCGWADVSFTEEDAVRAGLLVRVRGKETLEARSSKGEVMPWEKYTNDMYIWRAISRAARRYFPDVLMGMLYTPEEIGAGVDEDGQPVSAGSVRMDVPPEVAQLSLRIAACESRADLRVLHAQAKSRGYLAAEVDGVSILDRLNLRLADLPDDRPAPAPEAAAPAAEAAAAESDEAPAGESPAAAEPKADEPVDAETVEEDLRSAAAESADETTEAQAAAAADPEADDEFDRLAAAVDAGAPVVVADPAESREDTPRRRAVENALSQLFESPDELEAAGVEYFGLGLDDVSTERLQAWALELRKGAK
jgi:hypothetical protein